MPAGATRDAGEIAVAFTRVLRGAGLRVPTSSTIAFGEALAARASTTATPSTGRGRRRSCTAPEDHDLFDRAFGVLRTRTGVPANPKEELLHVTLAIDAGDDDEGDGPTGAAPPTTRSSSCGSAPPRCSARRTSPSTPPTSSSTPNS
jgi:uncharacterized protein with von Willebrand factor type A (vWA) domain